MNNEFYEEYGHLNRKELSDQLLGFCDIGQLEEVKYVLTSPELKEHANIHAENDEPFNLAFQRGHIGIIEYLIFEQNMPRTKNMVNHMNSQSYFEPRKEIVENWFRIRELNNQLKDELQVNQSIIKPQAKL